MKRSILSLILLLTAVCAGQVHTSIIGSATETTLAIVGILIGLQTIQAFLTQGGRLFSPSSVALYGILVFGIFPAIYAAFGFRAYEHRTTVDSLIITVTLIGVLQWVIITLCPTRKCGHSDLPAMPFSPNVGPFAAFLLALTVLFQVLSVPFLPGATGLVSVFSSAFSLAAARTTYQSVMSVLLLGASASYYALSIFTGFGRLNLAVVGVGVLILLSLRYSGYLVKVALLAATAPAMILLSYQRMSFLEEARGTDISINEGIGSIVGPFISGSIIVDRMLEGVIQPSLGTTIFAALVVGIPSEIWSGKPPGFGSEMVYITQPHLSNVAIFSDAGLITGEAVWNFGVTGSILMFVLVAGWIRLLDKSFLGFVTASREHTIELAQACYGILIVALSSGLLNIIWGGWHTYTSRLFVIVPLLLAFFIFFKLRRRPRPRGRETGSRAPGPHGGARTVRGYRASRTLI